MSQATAAAPAPTPKPAAPPAPVPGVTPAPTARPAEGTDLAAARGMPSALTRWRLIAALGVLAFTALTVAQLVLGMNAASRAAADADQVIPPSVDRFEAIWAYPGAAEVFVGQTDVRTWPLLDFANDGPQVAFVASAAAASVVGVTDHSPDA